MSAGAMIDGYQVETDDGESISCHVTHDRSRTSASLAYLLDSGYLYGEDMNDTHFVEEKTIDRIETWAEEHGY